MLHTFVHNEAFGGILMLAFAIAAMIWANSRWGDDYVSFWHTYFTVGTERFNLEMSLHHWVNDGLMAIFFLVVGLEIKREVLVGELASISRATLPAVAAAGGAIVPAIIFLAINAGTDGAHGWGVPMATDIAFAVGVVILAGSRVPLGLRVFLMALAIVDDLMAVLVIAVFYTAELDLPALGGAAAILAALMVVNRLGTRRLLVYIVLGIGLWYFVLQSGVHATVAGVLLALTIPVNTRLDPASFVQRVERILGRIERDGLAERSSLNDGHIQDAIQELEGAVSDVEAPLHNLERPLHPWTAFLIIPILRWPTPGYASMSVSVRPLPIGSRSASSWGSSLASKSASRGRPGWRSGSGWQPFRQASTGARSTRSAGSQGLASRCRSSFRNWRTVMITC